MRRPLLPAVRKFTPPATDFASATIAMAVDHLHTLEQLLAIPISDRRAALVQAADLAAEAFGADKIDVFLYDPEHDTLVAEGVSTQPLSALERKHGLDRLPVVNGGRTVESYVTGRTWVNGRADLDLDEIRGIREALKVKSQLVVALDVGEKRRGVLLVVSQEPDKWSEADGRFAETMSRWIAAVIRQAELVGELEASARAAGRRVAAEELVTVLAHDLRNFIFPVDLSLQVVERRVTRDNRADDAKELGKARKGLERLSALVTDILDVARIDQGAFTVMPRVFGLTKLVEEIASVMTTDEHPVIVLNGEEVGTIADPARIRQCIENLIANAVKHSPRLAPIHLTVRTERHEDGDWACVEITDRGAGIAGDLLPHVFERFVTGGGEDRGLGLGLFLARQIALVSGGDLEVSSKEGEGARFTLSLPSA